MLDLKIKKIEAMEVFDSRGNPTVQVTVVTEDDSEGIAIVPSGASTGYYEAVELRDLDRARFKGQGVKKAVDNVNKIISKHLIGKNVYNQEKIDNIMIKLDGTENKEKLGANAILGVSIATLKAAANSLNIPLYEYIGGISGILMPIPMMNIINGGKHSDNNLNIQEFMIVPIGGNNFKEYMKMCVEIYQTLKQILKEKKLLTAVGDEGGYAPKLGSNEEAFQRVVEAIEADKYDVIILNYANCDMVGHTGIFDAAKTAVEAVDTCVGRMVDAIMAKGGVALITADHGNADKMYEEDGSPFTAHTTFPVPFVVCGYDCELREGGKLCDIAPTMLKIMGLAQPDEMNGESIAK